MKRQIISILLLLAALFAGMMMQRLIFTPDQSAGTGSATEVTADKPQEPLYWVAPMDKNYRRDQPGKSPMGMDLVPVYADENEADETGGIRISPSVENNLGVRTITVGRSDIERPVDGVGTIGFNEETMRHIHTRADGWIEELDITHVGQRVDKGQRLLSLYSPTLVNAQDEYLAAVKSGQDVLVSASAQRLRALGMTSENVLEMWRKGKADDFVETLAERQEWVAELTVRQGMYITPGTPIMTLVDLKSVWMMVEVLERQSDWVRVGQTAIASMEAFPGKQFEGVVDYVYPELDPRTRTLKIRLRFDNPDLALKPNMYARVRINTEPLHDVLCLPLEAVIRTGQGDRVLLAMGDGRYRARNVVVGLVSGQHVEIISGIEEGQRVVTSAQFLLDSEASQAAEFERMSDRESP
jgi:Cu(I)/Ag(I) efflux system membrane fusion protein